MKNLKLLLVLLVMTISSTALAGEVRDLRNPDSVSIEIERMLKDLNLANKCEALEVTVYFSVSEDQKIQSLSVASTNEEVRAYIQKQLANHQLPSGFWMEGKIYELTIVKGMS